MGSPIEPGKKLPQIVIPVKEKSITLREMIFRDLNINRKVKLHSQSSNVQTGYTELSIFGWNPRSVRICVKSRRSNPASFEISVVFFKDGTCWDMAGLFEAAPVRTPGGWVCLLCQGESTHHTRYRSTDMLVHKHVLEPFAAWFEAKFLPCLAVRFCQTAGGGMTWVELDKSRANTGCQSVTPQNRLRRKSSNLG